MLEVLSKDLEAYEHEKSKLLEKYEGKFVVFKDGALIGVYESFEEAFRNLVEKYGFVPALIKEVEKEERVEEFPSLMRGLLSVATE
ncbi:MAG: DUF5678 domain-containing protein [Thermoproteota archaeon]